MINCAQKHAQNNLNLTLKYFYTLYIGLHSENNNELHLNQEQHNKA